MQFIFIKCLILFYYFFDFHCSKLKNLLCKFHRKLTFYKCQIICNATDSVCAYSMLHYNVSIISGGDDRRVLLWNISEAVYDRGLSPAGLGLKLEPKEDGCQDKNCPISMKRTHNSNIFCVAFDSKNERIFSGGNDDQVIIHEVYS